MSFTRTIENFICKHCKAKVTGSGYTNHCPKCLWSRHVDIFPGDRNQKCKGLMEPIGLETKNNRQRIIHKCQKCGTNTRCKISKLDDTNAIINLSQTIAKKAAF